MIAHLRGRLVERGADAVVIDVAGVGYAVMITAGAFRALPAAGSDVQVYTYTHAVQDGPLQLYGFVDPGERRLFEALLSVQGVGPKVAVAILSGLQTPDLVRAIAGGDIARLTQIRGVGRKIAERLAVELRDKIAALGASGTRDGSAPPTPPASSTIPSGRLGEVHGALVSLGYRPSEFESVLGALDAEQPIPDLIKQALAALRRK
jgi:Holliday junction DNA helicase RuvA